MLPEKKSYGKKYHLDKKMNRIMKITDLEKNHTGKTHPKKL